MAVSPSALSCSVVVATRHRPELLDRCLRSLARSCDGALDVVVVDNSDGHPPTRQVAERHAAQYAVAPGTGLSGARNIGLSVASGDIVAFLDDDTEVLAGWLPAILAPFADPFVASVTGRILPTEVTTEAQFWSARVHWRDLGPERMEYAVTTPDWFERANFGGIGYGGNMAIRRRVVDEWPGFRETLGLGAPLPGGEENYAFFELIRLGFSVVYAPDAAVLHPLPPTFGELRARRRRLLGQAIAYMALLIDEEPAYRLRLARYTVRRTVRRIRTRPRTDQPSWRSVFLPTDVLGAAMRAPVLLWRTLRIRPRPSARPTAAAGIRPWAADG